MSFAARFAGAARPPLKYSAGRRRRWRPPAAAAARWRLRRRERTRDLLQTTAMVHEACLTLDSQHGLCWHDRKHFFAFAARVMRRVLVDLVRRREREKRGAGAIHLTLAQAEEVTQRPSVEVLRVHEALADLETRDPEAARLVELRFFWGLSIVEAAAVLGLSPTTANRRWRVARAWIYNYLNTS